MASFSEYTEKQKKKKKDFAEYTEAVKAQNTSRDIAPVKSSNNGGNGVFKKSGLWDDGYQAGDVASAILATGIDFFAGLVQGEGELLEGIVDLGAHTVAAGADLFGADEFAEKTRNFANTNYMKDAVDDFRMIDAPFNSKTEMATLEEASLLGNFGYGVAEGLGQLIPIVATGGIAGAAGAGAGVTTAITTGITGASSMGSGISEAYNDNATDREAWAYGTMKGSIDAGTELIFGGLGKGVKALGVSRGISSLDDVFAKKLSSKISNQFAKTAVEYGVKASAEGFEEVLAGIGTAAAKKLTYMSDEELDQLIKDENLLEQFAMGAVVSGIAQGGDFVSSTKTGRDFITDLTTNEETVVEAEFQSRVKAEEQNGKKLTNKQKNEIYEQVKEDLQKGYISTDTIESVLGDDKYETYRDIVSEEEATIKEFESMYEGDELKAEIDKLLQNSKRGAAQAELSEYVQQNLTRQKGKRTLTDTFLVESYNEKARRGQDFAADVSQYDEAQQATIQKAIDSGILNNTRRTHELVDFIAKLSADKGVSFDFTSNEKLAQSSFAVQGKTVNGYVAEDGSITLNVESAKTLNTVVGHEVAHVLEGTELYDVLQEMVFAYAASKKATDKKFQSEYHERLYNARQLYKDVEGYEGVEGFKKIKREVVADLVGDYLFTDPDFINNLSTKHRNVFEKIYDEIKYLCKVATAGSKEARQLERVKRAFEEAYRADSKANTEVKTEDIANADARYSISVTDKKTIDFLENQEHITTYKAMQLIDGKLYPPMAAKVKGEDGKYRLNNPSELGKWQQATEDPTNIKKVKNGVGYYTLNKGNGKSIDAAYNPYEHSSNLVLNDQFEEAYNRDNIVTVECEIPVSEMESGYKAEYAKDGTGVMDWKSGVVAGKIKDNKRKVYLSRWLKPVRILSDAETAAMYKDVVGDVAVPFNVVTPNLLAELEKVGVNIDYDGSPMYKSIQKRKAAKSETKYSLTQDSEGKKLTKEQSEYFKDSKALDRNGNLLKVYHTTNSDFTVFDKSKQGEATGDTNTYLGFFFADDAEYMQNFPEFKNGKTEAYYLNMKNPIDMTNISKEAFIDVVEVLGGDVSEAAEIYEQELSDEKDRAKLRGDNNTSLSLIRLLDEMTGDADYHTFIDELKPHYNELMSKGYDGVVNYLDELYGAKEYIILDSNQAKLASNTKPTKNADIRYSISGANALTANSSMLLRAEHMLNAGADSETVRQETGWYKGYDGKMRFEIDDSKSELIENPNLEKHEDNGTYFTGKLSDILEHSELYEAYPQLRNVNIIIQPTDIGTMGIYQPNSNYITLSMELFKRHTKEYSDLLNNRQAEIKRIEETPEYKEYDKWHTDEAYAEMEDAEKWLEEEEKARVKFFSSELGKKYYQLKWGKDPINKYELGWSKEAKSVLMHEVQHAVQKIENFARGSSKSYWNRQLEAGLTIKTKEQRARQKEVEDKYYGYIEKDPSFYVEMNELMNNAPDMPRGKVDWETLQQIEEDPIEWQEFDKKRDALEEKYGSLEVFEFMDLYHKVRELQKESLTADEAYYLTAGEIEARDTENRLNLNAEQRRNKRPDIDNKRVVFADQLYSLSEDSQGRKLSQGQAERFKDSLVRDDNGKLYVVYHASPSKFTEFKHSKIGGHGTSLGKGFYFTEDINLASSFYKEGGQLLKGYLDIRKPLIDGKKTIKKAELGKLIKAICEAEAKYLVDVDGYDTIQDAIKDTFISNYVNTYDMPLANAYSSATDLVYSSNDTDVDVIGELINAGGGASRVLGEVRRVLGYDGVIFKHPNGVHEFVTFESNQFKNIDNLNPTDDPDIRLSLSAEGEQPKRYGKYNVSGKDIMLEKAPVREEAPVNGTTSSEMKQVADIIPDVAPMTEEEANALQSERLNSIDDADAPPEFEAPYYGDTEDSTVADPFEERDIKEVGNRQVKAYMYENPEVKPFFQKEANSLLGELDRAQPAQSYYNGWLKRDMSYEAAQDIPTVYRTKRVASPDIEYLLDTVKMSYDDIRKGLNAIIEDHGAENIAAAKKIEFILNDRLMNGYTDDTLGFEIPANQDYINLIREKQITEYSEEAARAFFENADQYAPPVDDIAPIAESEIAPTKEYEAIKPKPQKPTGEEAQWAKNKMARADKVQSEEEPTAQILETEPEAPKQKGRAWQKFVTDFVDKHNVFERLALKTKNRTLMAKANHMLSSDSRAQWLIGNGAEGVKSLNDIRAEVESTGHTKQFYEYLYHKHNVDRMNLENRYQDVKNKPVFGYDITAEKSQEIVNQYEFAEPKFKEYAQAVYDYMNYLRKQMVDNGVISQETADLWAEMYPHYVPIRRLGDTGLNINVPLDTGRTGVNAPIKRATGGNRDILPLFDTMAMRTQQTYRAIARNSFGVELKNTLGTGVAKNKVNFEEVVDSIEKHDELLQKGENGRNPTFTVFENGEKVTFEITEEMYDALKPTSDRLAYTNKALNTVSNVRKGMITEYNPVFMITNALKDVQDLLINSQHPFQTYKNLPKAYKELTTKGKWYTEYMQNGGEDNTYFDKDSNTFKAEDEGFKKTIGMPLRAISAANNFIERAPRLAEYIASREAGASVEVAMLDAARVTTNFSAGGDVTKFLNRNGATFLNASVQGFNQQIRNIREAKTKGLKGWLGLAAKFAIAGLPAALLNSLMWEDDEEYEELSDYVKQNYYVVAKYGDGQFVRIPKGRTVAVIQNAFEQVNNALTGDDEVDFNSFFELFINNLAPNNPIENNIFSPIVDVARNKTWYGEDLVPTRLQDLPAAEQYDESTDSLSRWLGETFNYSPYKINYLIDQYSGALGDVFLPMMTPEAESGDNSFAGNLIAPLKDKFTTDSVMNNQNVSDFYNTVDELAANANSSKATDEDILKYKYINSVSSDMSDLYKQKREIQNSDLPDDEKYAEVRKLQNKINNLARSSLNAYKTVNIEDGYAVVGDRAYRLNDKGEWVKLTDKQLESQDLITSALGITESDYWQNKSEYDFAYEYPEKYTVAKAVGGYDAYKAFASDIYDIKADKDKDGKSITGSRKRKVSEYINSLNADYGEKIIMFKSVYNADDTYNAEIVKYLDSRSDISYEEMIIILKELGFTISEDGQIVKW